MVDDPDRSPLSGVMPEVDASEFSDRDLLTYLGAADALEAQSHARRLLSVARLARRRMFAGDLSATGGRGGPGVDSRALADPLLAGVREDFVAELALARNCSESEAQALLRESVLATTVLAPTWSALFAGRIRPRHMAAAVDLLGDAAPRVAAEVQQRVLPRADGMTVAAFRDRLRYHLYRLDSAARDRRRREAAQKADVRVWPKDEGISTLGIDMSTARCLAARAAIDQYAQWLRADGDERPIGVLRSEAAWALLMRPWDTSRPPVTALLTIHAALPSLRPEGDPRQSQQPADIDGQVVTAAECRELLRELGILQLGTPPLGGSTQIAVTDPATGEVVAVASRKELERGAGRRRTRRRGRPGATPPDGPGLRRPADTASYEPTAGQKRLVKVRDRHCRMPGCRRRPGRCDIDHGQAYRDGGPTACWNLCCLCRRHHRIKTFARGWHFELLPDGRLIVRTPSGIYRTTVPPGWCFDAEPDPPWLEELAPPEPMLT
jgi:hypothetical protein